MPDIMIVLACLSQCLDTTTLRHLTRVTEAILSMTGRVTMRGIARWSGQGGSYRTVQRFFNTTLSWCQLQWLLIRTHLLDEDDVIVAAGDDVLTPKSGKTTHGLDRFFSSLYGKVVPGLGFLSLSLISVKRRVSYPVMMEPIEKTHTAKPQEISQKKSERKRGRPKGSKNQNRRDVDLSLYLRFVQETLKRLLQLVGEYIQVVYFIFDGAFGHKKFAELLNIFVMVKTNLKTQEVAHVVLFSSDLELPYDQVIDYYRLRFQIEFNFRDAKQYWGLEDFMVVNRVPVYNSANLAMFMVNVSHAVMHPLRPHWPEFSVNDLKTWFRSRKYVVETLKLLPEMPEPICIDQVIAQVAELGRINRPVHPV